MLPDSASSPVSPLVVTSRRLEGAPDTLRAIGEGEIDVTPMITGTCGIDGVPAAFEALGHPDDHVKILVEPGGAPGIVGIR